MIAHPRVLLTTLLLVLAIASPSVAQMLRGDWVDATQERIERVRKTELRLIVLGRDGRPVPGASVTIEQLSHDFPLGYALIEPAWPTADPAAPVWRCFNAVSLEPLTGWTRLTPTPDTAPDVADLEELVIEAQRRGMRTRWGGVISADVGRNPDWAAALNGDALVDALENHLQLVLRLFGGRVDAFDVYTHALDHRFVEDRLGKPMVRRLFQQAKVYAPRSTMAVRFTDSLQGTRLHEMVEAVMAMQQDFIPLDAVALEQRTAAPVAQAPLARALEGVGRLGLDIHIVGLEVGGASEAAAAMNLETMLRTLFAEQAVDGIWFGAIRPGAVAVPEAALVDAQGQPTEAGQVVDGLFRKLWWTNATAQTDELGNVTARVFAGSHRITATLPDGTDLTTRVHLPRHDDPRIVVLQPLNP